MSDLDSGLLLTRAELEQQAAAADSAEAALQPALLAVARPLVVCRVLRTGATGTASTRVWAGRERAVAHPDGADGSAEPLLSVSAALLPQLLLRLTGLGPRPRTAALDLRASVEEAAAMCAGERPAAWEQADDPTLWRLDWSKPGGLQRRLGVLDLGSGGLHEPAEGEAWVPTDAGRVLDQLLAPLFAVALG